MSNSHELIQVKILFSTSVTFSQTVQMRRSLFDKIDCAIEDDEDVDLTEYIEWSNPFDVGDSEVMEFSIVGTSAQGEGV